MNRLSGFQRDILYIVSELDGERGLKIKSELEDYLDTDVNHGRLYPNLDELVDEGLIIKGQIDKRTNSYALSQKGEKAIRQRREWENDKLDLDEQIEKQPA